MRPTRITKTAACPLGVRFGRGIRNIYEGNFTQKPHVPGRTHFTSFRQTSALLASVVLLACLAGCQRIPKPIEWKGGSYQGETADGMPQGFGRIVYPRAGVSGIATYTGSWVAGKKQGNGILIWMNGDRYVGEFRGNMRYGRGQMYKKGGARFDGQWVHDSIQGYGVLHRPNGDLVMGTWQGAALDSGRIVFTNHDVYEGYIDSTYNADGQGRCTYANGTIYEGYWRKGIRNGFGIWIGSDGTVRVGQWVDGHYIGEKVQHSKKRVYGIDLSRHQHKAGAGIRWNRLQIVRLGSHHDVSADAALPLPVSFVIIKATEGKGMANRFFRSDYLQARRHGLVVGAYHYFTTAPVALQVRNFVRTARLSRGDFPPLLDLEPTDEQIERMGGRQQMFIKVLQWLTAVERHYGARPILYVSQRFVNKTLSHGPSRLQHYKYWIARYSEYKPYVSVDFWQLDSDGKVSGIPGPVDINLYNGSKAQFRSFINIHGIH
jgi:lysozyme